jgi:hypothetical protein
MWRISMKSRLFCLAIVAAVLVSSLALIPQSAGNDRVLTKIKFIHYRDGQVKAVNPARPPKGDTGQYSYISRGAKWRVTENFVVNPINGQALSDALVVNAVTLALSEWENYGGEIFGDVSIDYSAAYNDDATDGVNAVSFGPYPQNNVIAVTIIWGYFGGPQSSREIIETDVLFNTAFTWGDATATPSVMDLQNIATHELGHAAGMGDLYLTSAIQETMYGYSTEGETSKRDLYKGDMAGITKLYQ